MSKKFSGLIIAMEVADREDLDLANHLVGLKQRFVRLRFHTTADLAKVKKDLLSAVRRNKENMKSR